MDHLPIIDLEPGEQFRMELAEGVCIKLAYPDGADMDCNVVEVATGLRFKVPEERFVDKVWPRECVP